MCTENASIPTELFKDVLKEGFLVVIILPTFLFLIGFEFVYIQSKY